MFVDDKSILLFRQIFIIRDGKIKIGFATLRMLNALSCMPHALDYGAVMIKAISNGCLYKIIFNSTASLEYNFVVVEDSVMLSLVKRKTSMSSFFNNPDLIKMAVMMYSLRFMHNSLMTRTVMAYHSLCRRKTVSLREHLKLELH